LSRNAGLPLITLAASPTLEFLDLPEDPIFTLGVDVPSAWLVRPRRSIHDLDNLRLSDLDSDVKPVFELENLLIEGHAREGVTRAPPRGLQVQIKDPKGTLVSDTIVMANLGYFQLYV
jgi:UDP-glucose:glycoprotein glucosyltransferase